MASTSVKPPYQIFTDSDGQPLEDGYIWIGQANMDPQANPLAVYWDSNLTQPAGQPIRTLNGYASNNGTPGVLYVSGDYSIRVLNKKGILVYSYLNASVDRFLASQVSYQQNGTGAISRTLQEKVEEMVSILDFGADRTGVNNSAQAIQNALNSGAKKVYAPSGTYKILSTITIPTNVSFVGDGSGSTVLDGSSASYYLLTDGAHIRTQSGTLTSIPNLSSNASLGDVSITLTSAPQVSRGSIINIYNPTDSSWSPERPYYRAGEWARVASVSGSIVGLQGGLSDNYTTSAVSLYALTNSTSFSLKGFSLKGLSDTINPVNGIAVNNGVDFSIEDVSIIGCSYSGIQLYQCFNGQIRNVTIQEDFSNNFGGDYGLAILNSNSINVVGGYFSASRHGITSGGNSNIGCVPNRYITIDGATISTASSSPCADFHANTEYSGYYNCTMNAGVSIGGNFIQLKNNFFRGSDPYQKVPIYCTSLRGATIDIQGNTIWNNRVPPSTYFPTHIDISFLEGRLAVGGTTTIRNNNMLWNGVSVPTSSAILIERTSLLSTEINVIIENNTLTSTSSTQHRAFVFVTKYSNPVPAFTSLSICNNKSTCGGIWIHSGVVTTENATDVTISGNDFANSTGEGIMAQKIGGTIVIKGNKVSDCSNIGILIVGVASKAKYAEISSNTVINCLRYSTGSSETDTSMTAIYSEYCVVKNNSSSNYNKVLPVTSSASFAIGDTITGATSGTTAKVLDIMTGFLCIGTTASGVFTIGETINGSPSGGSTTTTGAESYPVTGSVGISNITKAYVANNVDARDLNVVRVTIGGYARGSEWVMAPLAYDPPNLISGAGAIADFPLTPGTEPGDIVLPAFSTNLLGITITGSVRIPGVPSVRFQNGTTVGLDLAGGTLNARVIKA